MGYKPWKDYQIHQRKDLQKYEPMARRDVADDMELLNQLAKYEKREKQAYGFVTGVAPLRSELREQMASQRIMDHGFGSGGSGSEHNFRKNRHGRMEMFPNPKHPSNKITTHLNNQEHINNLRIKKNVYNHRRSGE